MWQARFSQHTPPRLISAFTTALAEPSPLLRTAPLSSAAHDPRFVIRTTRNVPAAQIASALGDRVRTLAARRATPPTDPPAPKRPPASPSRRR